MFAKLKERLQMQIDKRKLRWYWSRLPEQQKRELIRCARWMVKSQKKE